MGYTHYWRQKRDFTKVEWTSILAYTQKIVKVANIPLANAMGDPGTEPTFNEERICFNGVGSDAHKTFVLTRQRPMYHTYLPQARQELEGVPSFCKTAQKLYDPIVVSILVEARRVAPDAITISSDGGVETLVAQF